MDALKPLLVLGLLGTILYGAYSIVQKGPAQSGPAWQPPAVEAGLAQAGMTSNAPPFVAPAVEMTPPVAGHVVPSQPMNPPAAVPATSFPTPVAAALPAATAAVAAAATDRPPTYLNAQSAAPPVADPLPTMPPAGAAPFTAPETLPTEPPSSPIAAAPATRTARSAAFASAWAEAHDKLAAGRYAEALALLSVWYDDTSLGPEESQRLEDLLSQLAGSVIYSQQDLLLPPYVVAAGDTLQSVSAPLGVPWQLLAKINGVEDPAQLVPGEQLKVLRGPFDAVVSVSRGRLSLQVGGNYAGSFPVMVGRQVQERVGASLSVVDIRRGSSATPSSGSFGAASQVAYVASTGAKAIVLGDGLTIDAVEDPSLVADTVPTSSLVVAARDLDEIVDILGPGSHVLVRK